MNSIHRAIQIIATLTVVLFLNACATQSPMTQQDNEQLLRLPYISHTDGANREYFVYLPKGYDQQADKHWPVMMFLHGNGERGNGLDELDYVITHGPLYEAWIQKKDLPFIIIAPQLHMFGVDEYTDYIRDRVPTQIPQRLENGVPDRPAPFGTEGPMSGSPQFADMSAVDLTLPRGWDKVEQDLLDMLNYVENNYRTNTAKTYLTGLSYGGFGTWWMASKHPEKFAAIAPVVGWGHPKLMAPIAENKLPVWAFAGGRDTAVQVQYFYPGMNELEKLGHKVMFTTHEDMAHDAWTRVYASADLYTWLLQYSLDSNQ